MNPLLLALLSGGMAAAPALMLGDKKKGEEELSEEEMLRMAEKEAATNYAMSPAHQDRMPSMNKELEAQDEINRQARMKALQRLQQGR